jgi:hypothetical protein
MFSVRSEDVLHDGRRRELLAIVSLEEAMFAVQREAYPRCDLGSF